MLALQSGSMKEYQKQREQREAVHYGEDKSPLLLRASSGGFQK
jgi:hypothetical protein